MLLGKLTPTLLFLNDKLCQFCRRALANMRPLCGNIFYHLVIGQGLIQCMIQLLNHGCWHTFRTKNSIPLTCMDSGNTEFVQSRGNAGERCAPATARA